MWEEIGAEEFCEILGGELKEGSCVLKLEKITKEFDDIDRILKFHLGNGVILEIYSVDETPRIDVITPRGKRTLIY